MARQPRLNVPGCPHHVIQRGNNSQPIVLDDTDRLRLLALLAEQARRCRVALHAYVLLDNQFQLLATPETAEGLPQLMQAVGRSYARHFNQRHSRTGTLWDGRYRSTVIEAEPYLLVCMVSMDLSPVRAGLTLEPADHRWSSYRHCIGWGVDKWITPHALLWRLGNTPFAREAAYEELVRAGISAEQQEALSRATMTGWVLGSAAFIDQLQQGTARRLVPAKPGRPPRRSIRPKGDSSA